MLEFFLHLLVRTTSEHCLVWNKKKLDNKLTAKLFEFGVFFEWFVGIILNEIVDRGSSLSFFQLALEHNKIIMMMRIKRFNVKLTRDFREMFSFRFVKC